MRLRWWPASLRNQAIVLIAAMIGIGALSTTTVLRLNGRQDEAYAAADSARNLQLDLGGLHQAMLEQETGLRGYAVTGVGNFLKPYDAGRASVPPLEERLRREMPAAGGRTLTQLLESVVAWQSWAEQRRAAIAETGPDSTPDKGAVGRALFDVFRARQSAADAFAASWAQSNLRMARERSDAQNLGQAIGAVLVLLMLGGLAAILLYATLAPVRRLADVADELAAGRAVDIPSADRKDEVGALARALKGWQVAERERTALAGAMSEVSEKVELQAILDAATDRLMRLAEADQLVISVAGGDGTFDVVKSHPAPFTPSASLPAGSPGHRAVAAGRPLIADLRDPGWDGSIELWRDEHRLGPAMAVPLISAGRMLGVATLLRHQGGPAFSAADVERAIIIFPYLAAALNVSRLFANLHSANLELERASRLKSEFLASMSHELRTPLNSILGFSQLLLDHPDFARDEERYRRYLNNINSSGRHLLGLINDVLDLSKIESGRMELTLDEMELGLVAASALSIAESLASAKAIRLTADMEPDLNLRADAGRVKQVLINLLSNAIKFTPAGGAVLLSADRQNGQVRIRVNDTGVGIAPADQSRIFEEFQQVNPSSTSGGQGTGLGLALTKRFVEMHGGSISVESELGRGSTFTVWLPRAANTELAQWETSSLPPRSTVLVVEDDPASAALLVEYLSSGGYRAVVAPNSEAGLRLARELKPLAITLDLLLPNRQGLSMISELKAQPDTRAIPVVVVSVNDDRRSALAMGAVDHLVKPIESASLLQSLSRHVRHKNKKPVVLVVDNEPAARMLAATTLAAGGYDVIEAEGGHDGIDMARSRLPDAIVLDLIMPGVSGFDVIQALRADPSTAALPVVVVTAKTLDAEERRLLEASTRAVLAKDQAHDLWTDLIDWIKRVTEVEDAGRGAYQGPESPAPA